MIELRAWVVRLVSSLVAGLVVIDVLDDLLLGNKWSGCPKELFGLLGAIIAGLFAASAIGRNGKAKEE